MGLADTAKLVVNLSLAGNFASSLGKAGKSLDTFDGKVSRTSSRGYQAGQQIGTGIKNGARIAAVGIGILASQVALGLRSLVELEQATAQTEAVIKSTGGAAGVSAEQVRVLSEKYEALNATIGDEVIQSGQNLLLTFTAIGKEAFEPTLKAALDLSTALGTDLDSAITTVGKALSDPAKAMARLRRQGIILTKAEQKQIDAHLDNNDALGAQNVILAALDKRYGGSFLGKGGTTAGKVAKFTDSIEDLQRVGAELLLPTIGNIADEMSTFLQDPAVVQGVKDLGKDIAGLFSKENIRKGADVLGGFLRAAKDAAPAIGAAAKAAGAVIGTAVKLFNSLPPEIQSLAIGGLAVNKLTGGLVTNLAGGLISSVLKQLVSGVVNVNGGVVNVVGGGAGGLAGKAGGAAAGIGVGTLLAGAALTAAAVAAVAAVQQDQSGKNTEISAGIKTGLDNSIAGKSLPELRTAMAGVDQGIKDLSSNPLYALVQGEALDNLRSMKTSLAAQIANTTGGSGNVKEDRNKPVEPVAPAVAKLRTEFMSNIANLRKGLEGKGDKTITSVEAAKAAVNASKDRLTAAAAETKRETSRGAMLTASASRLGASQTSLATMFGSARIVSAIYANRPVINTNVNVNATTVTKTATVAARYGPSGGSRTRDAVGPNAGGR